MKLNTMLAGLGLMASLAFVGPTPSFASLTSEQRLEDFSQLVNIIERNYAPLRLKRKTINLDFRALVSRYRERVLAAKSDSELYRTFAEFLSELKDSHVSPVIPSTYRASLGFVSDYVAGKVLIEQIDRTRLPELLFPFKKGDQVISIGGVPVEQLLEQLSRIGHTGNEASTKRISAARLSIRRESAGLAVPKGVTTITVLQKGASRPVTVTATWIISGLPLVELDDLAGLMESGPIVNAIPTADNGETLFNEVKKLSLFNLSLPNSVISEMQKTGISDIGALKSMFTLPEGAKELPFFPVTAAIYEAGGKKIGILRIPSYGDDGLLEVIARAILTMESQTDVLVLDQTNNPGGSVSLVSNIVSLFADRSYKDMDFEIRPSVSWLHTFQSINTKIAEMLKEDPNEMTANALRARFEYLESEIRDSIGQKKFLTNPVSLNLVGTFGMIQPSGMVSYSKPVLLLINEFDFSGGDAFPALMKDNGRVTLFGAQTSGAGGNVREHGPLSNSFFKLNLTESLMIRPNGEYVENYGVRPDIEYAITENDFMNGYRDYVKAFTVEALKLVGVSKEQFEAAEAAKAAAKLGQPKVN